MTSVGAKLVFLSIVPTLPRGNAAGDAPASRFCFVEQMRYGTPVSFGAGRRRRPGSFVPTLERGNDGTKGTPLLHFVQPPPYFIGGMN